MYVHNRYRHSKCLYAVYSLIVTDKVHYFYMHFKSPATIGQGGEMPSPATSILQSTERVANVIVNSLSVKRKEFTISRPNVGKYAIMQNV